MYSLNLSQNQKNIASLSNKSSSNLELNINTTFCLQTNIEKQKSSNSVEQNGLNVSNAVSHTKI